MEYRAAYQGPVLNASSAANSTLGCCEQCLRSPQCSAYVFCADPGGCLDGSGATQAYGVGRSFPTFCPAASVFYRS